MRRLKSFLCVLSACALVMSLSGCGGDSSTQSGDEDVWIIAHTVTEDIALHKAFVQVAENIKEATDGKFVIEIYPNSLMGGNREVLEGMQFDTFQMTMPNVGMLGGYSDQISVLELPYLIEDVTNFEDADAVYNSDILQPIYDDLADAGFLWLGSWYQGNRHLTTTKTPVHTPADMKGLKIRVQVASMMGDTVEALGAEAVPIAYAELYTALESRTIDGADNPPVSYYYNKFYKVAPYYVKDRHTYTPGVILVSKITWKNLKKEYQDALVQAAKETQEYNRTAIEEADQKAYEALEKEGVTILEPEDPQAWSQAMEPVYRKYGGEYLDLIEKIRQIR